MLGRITLVILSFCLSVSTAFADIETKPIRVGIMLGQPPFSYEVAPQEYDGLAIKMWELVAKDLRLGKNLDIEIKELPNYFDFFLPLAGSEVYNASNNNEADRNA